MSCALPEYWHKQILHYRGIVRFTVSYPPSDGRRNLVNSPNGLVDLHGNLFGRVRMHLSKSVTDVSGCNSRCLKKYICRATA